MRLTILICGFVFLAGPVAAQTLMPAPSPEPMMARITPGTPAAQSGKQADPQADAQLNRQVSVVQQRLQQEEQRLQSQFAQLQRMRAAALEKQNKQELDRIEGLEKKIVADYQKRVEQVLIGAQTQIQATPIHVRGAQAQPTKAPTKASRTPTRPTQTQRTRTQPTQATRSQGQKQPSSKSNQSKQKSKSSGFWLFGRR